MYSKFEFKYGRDKNNPRDNEMTDIDNLTIFPTSVIASSYGAKSGRRLLAKVGED